MNSVESMIDSHPGHPLQHVFVEWLEEENTTYWMALFANRPHSLQDAGSLTIMLKMNR